MNTPKRSYVEFKAAVERELPHNHPARSVVSALADEMDDATADAVMPLVRRALMARPAEEGRR